MMKITCPSILDRSGIPVCQGVRSLTQILGYIGPGFFVTIGFIDPGNWATNIAAGSDFNYDLLWVVALSTAILILWQHMSAHLGIVKGKCLAEAVREHVRPVPAFIYGSTAMAACVATALAEILGAAIGLQLLFHIPIRAGAFLAMGFVLTMILSQRYGSLEKLIVGFVSAIGLCYLIELYLVKPDWSAAAVHTVVPKLNSQSIIIAMGVLGAVVMPHNMYLHSEVIQNRQWTGKSEQETRRLLRFEFVDTLVAMLVGFAINAAMVIVAASVFYKHHVHVTDLAQASATLEPLAGKLASVVFGIALLFAGVSSSITAGVAGATTFSGYCGKETSMDSKWFRAGLVITLIPACLLILAIEDTFQALIISQVCLSVQLPLTMLPLFLLTKSRRVMGKFANGWLETTLMTISGLIIVVLNVLLIYQVFGGKF
ncbi:MAG: Nramp family divalent metal transporter [Armatimonadetes bacterium]|nr:Nramp family divalent metal transporter [Armatimonadota bacterium]